MNLEANDGSKTSASFFISNIMISKEGGTKC